MKKVPLSGRTSRYRPLSGKYPPGLEATALNFKVQQSLSFRLSWVYRLKWYLFFVICSQGVLRISSDGDQWSNGGKTQNPRISQGFQENPKKYLDLKLTPKNPMPNFQALKIPKKQNKFVCNYSQNYTAIIQWALSWIVRLFWIPEKIPTTNQATQKNTCQIFLPQKIPESKISNPNKSFDHSPSLEFWSTLPKPPYLSLHDLNNFFPFYPKLAKIIKSKKNPTISEHYKRLRE